MSYINLKGFYFLLVLFRISGADVNIVPSLSNLKCNSTAKITTSDNSNPFFTTPKFIYVSLGILSRWRKITDFWFISKQGLHFSRLRKRYNQDTSVYGFLPTLLRHNKLHSISRKAKYIIKNIFYSLCNLGGFWLRILNQYSFANLQFYDETSIALFRYLSILQYWYNVFFTSIKMSNDVLKVMSIMSTMKEVKWC